MNDELFSPWYPGAVPPARPGLYWALSGNNDDDFLAWSLEAGWRQIDGHSAICPRYWRGLTARGHLLFRTVDQLAAARLATVQRAVLGRFDAVLRRVEEVARDIVVGRMDELAKEQRRRMDAFAEQFTAMHRKLDEMRQTRFAQWRATTKVEPPRAHGPFAVSSSYTFMPNATAAPPAKSS